MSDQVTSEINYGTSPKTLFSYVVGFILCIALTVIPFFAVMDHSAPTHWLYFIVVVCAVLQLIVQTVCFLRLNFNKDGLENSLSFIFVIFVALILIGGSMWIMWHMNYNMMH
jgi:cytochrome o ubiquinol oxidase operon protein cyoD